MGDVAGALDEVDSVSGRLLARAEDVGGVSGTPLVRPGSSFGRVAASLVVDCSARCTPWIDNSTSVKPSRVLPLRRWSRKI